MTTTQTEPPILDPHGGRDPNLIAILAELTSIRQRIDLIDPPKPPQAEHYVLPLASTDHSTGMYTKVKRGQKVEIRGRPQRAAFKPKRLWIGSDHRPITRWSRFVNWLKNRHTASGSGAWIVHDIQIGGRSQFVQAGCLPGDMFGADATESFLHFDTAQTAMDVTLIVEYVGPHKNCRFVGGMTGLSTPPFHYPADLGTDKAALEILRS